MAPSFEGELQHRAALPREYDGAVASHSRITNWFAMPIHLVLSDHPPAGVFDDKSQM